MEEHLHAVAFDEEGVVVISPLALHPALAGLVVQRRLSACASAVSRPLVSALSRPSWAWGARGWARAPVGGGVFVATCKWAGEGNKKKDARRLSLQLYFNYYTTHSTDRHNPDRYSR